MSVNFPLFPEFKNVGLEDRFPIGEMLRKFPSEASEANFGNTYIWRNCDHPQWTTHNGNLCLFFEPPAEEAYFLHPLGNTKIQETLRTCLAYAPRLARVPKALAALRCRGYKCEADRDNYDYVYLTQDLINLKGKKYDGKRNRIKKFGKSHSWRYLKLGPGRLDGCLKLLEDWVKAKVSNGSMMIHEREAISEALANFEVLGFVGGAIEVEDRIAAFSIGEELTPDTAVIHIEIVNPLYEGLAQLINREFVKNEWSACRFINREQDLGIPGLVIYCAILGYCLRRGWPQGGSDKLLRLGLLGGAQGFVIVDSANGVAPVGDEHQHLSSLAVYQ